MTRRNPNVQCKACPWRKSTVPGRDIPGGYCETKHAMLQRVCTTQATLSPLVGLINTGELRAMACHKSAVGSEYPCVGWVVNQLNEGNNLALRWTARDGRFKDMRTVGPQWRTLEETLGQGGSDDADEWDGDGDA